MRDDRQDVEQDIWLGWIKRMRNQPGDLWIESHAIQAFKCAYLDATRKFHLKKSVRRVQTLSELPESRATGIKHTWNGGD